MVPLKYGPLGCRTLDPCSRPAPIMLMDLWAWSIWGVLICVPDGLLECWSLWNIMTSFEMIFLNLHLDGRSWTYLRWSFWTLMRWIIFNTNPHDTIFFFPNDELILLIFTSKHTLFYLKHLPHSTNPSLIVSMFAGKPSIFIKKEVVI